MKVPGYDFDSFHLPVFHHPELCIEGDIFTHPNARKFSDAHLIKRKQVVTEAMMAQINGEMPGFDLAEGDSDWTDEMLSSFAEQGGVYGEEEDEEEVHSISEGLE